MAVIVEVTMPDRDEENAENIQGMLRDGISIYGGALGEADEVIVTEVTFEDVKDMDLRHTLDRIKDYAGGARAGIANETEAAVTAYVEALYAEALRCVVLVRGW